MKFRKKPVIVEAWQVPPPCDDQNMGLHGELCATLLIKAPHAEWEVADNKGRISIKTLEGTMTAENGDWIILGTEGELYPCKPNAFTATFEPVKEGK